MTSLDTTHLLADEGTITLPSLEGFIVRDAVKLGRTYGDLTVTYVGPNFLRLFGGVRVDALPERSARYFVLEGHSDDQSLAEAADGDAELGDLFSFLALGADGPARFDGESNTVYHTAGEQRWTPHFYTRGRRLGFGALPFGDAVGWEPGDVFFSAARA